MCIVKEERITDGKEEEDCSIFPHPPQVLSANLVKTIHYSAIMIALERGGGGGGGQQLTISESECDDDGEKVAAAAAVTNVTGS